METYTSKYIATLETVKAQLREHGVAVIPNVLSQAECQDIVDTLWTNLEASTVQWKQPVKRDDKTTWDLTNFSLKHGMLSQEFGTGHWEAAWKVRQHPAIANIFATLWEVDANDLLTSFDGISISLPPEVTGKGWFRKNGLWLHCDTSYYYKPGEDKSCYQGWFTPIDVNAGDATLAFLTGSHQYHKQFSEERNISDKSDWYKLTDDEISVYTHDYNCPLERITCKAGSFVLWDSRLIHCGQQPMKERAERNFRFCFYVCQMPRNKATSTQLKKKQKAFEGGRLTSHHPIKSKLFPKNPRVYGGVKLEPIVLPPVLALTPLGRRLAGYDS